MVAQILSLRLTGWAGMRRSRVKRDAAALLNEALHKAEGFCFR